MAKTRISEFDVNPDNNTDINSINIAEGCAPSGINNAIRQLMSDLKEFQTGAGGDPFNGAVNGTVGATTPATAVVTTLTANTSVSTDLINEKTSAAGITIDGVLLKDNAVSASSGFTQSSTFNSASTFGFKNRIINGNMTIAQRGTSFTGVSLFAYTLDRMKVIISYTGGSTNVTQQADAPDADSKYSIRYTQATANTSSISNYCNRQSIETSNVVDLAGGTVTLSFWYKSSRTGNHAIVVSPVGTTGGSATTATFTVTSANTWEFKTVSSSAFVGVTAWGTDNAEGAFVDVGFNCGGTGQSAVSSGDYFAISRLQLEKGSTATSFDYRSIGTELSLCQRYYEVIDGVYSTNFNGASNRNDITNLVWKATKRATPTLAIVSSVGASGTNNLAAGGSANAVQSFYISGAGLLPTAVISGSSEL